MRKLHQLISSVNAIQITIEPENAAPRDVSVLGGIPQPKAALTTNGDKVMAIINAINMILSL
jgi:hypothetical protein